MADVEPPQTDVQTCLPAELERGQQGGASPEDAVAFHPAQESIEARSPGRRTQRRESSSMRIERMITESQNVTAQNSSAGHWVLDHIAFQALCGSIVAANSLVLGFEAEVGPEPQFATMFSSLEIFFTTAFLFEMLLKLFWLRADYIKDQGNWLDAFVTVLGVVDVCFFGMMSGGANFNLRSLSILRTLRMVRLVRILKLLKQFKKMVVIIRAVVDAVRTTMWVALVLLGAIYVCAIFCVDVIGRGENVEELYPGYEEDVAAIDEYEVFAEFNPYVSFGSMGRAMLTLFNIAIMAEWAEVVWPISMKQPYMVLFFVLFGMFVTFGVMNVIIGLIVDNVMSNAREMCNEEEERETSRRLSALRQIELCFESFDKDGDGQVTIDEMRTSVLDGSLSELFREHGLKFDVNTSEFFSVLDENGDGLLDADEFVMAMYRLLGFEQDRASSLLMMAMKQVKFQGRAGHDEVARRLDGLEVLLEKILHRSCCMPSRAHHLEDWGASRKAVAMAEPRNDNPIDIEDMVLAPAAGDLFGVDSKPVQESVPPQQELHSDSDALSDRLDRALESLRRMESREAPFIRAATALGMEDVARVLEAARAATEDVMRSRLQDTVSRCLEVVQHAVEPSGLEWPSADVLLLSKFAEVGVAASDRKGAPEDASSHRFHSGSATSDKFGKAALSVAGPRHPGVEKKRICGGRFCQNGNRLVPREQSCDAVEGIVGYIM